MKNEIIHNKLVRDKIPEVISGNGKEFSSRIAGDEEYKNELLKKVCEELEEFRENPCEEELADIFEVLEGIIRFYKFNEDRISEIKSEKAEKRGAFDKRIILEKVWEAE